MICQHGKFLKALCWLKKKPGSKATYYTIPLIWHFGKDKTIRMENKSVVARG